MFWCKNCSCVTFFFCVCLTVCNTGVQYCMAHEVLMAVCVIHIPWAAHAVCVFMGVGRFCRGTRSVCSLRLWKLYLCDPETQAEEQPRFCFYWQILWSHKRFDPERVWIVWWKINECHSIASVDVCCGSACLFWQCCILSVTALNCVGEFCDIKTDYQERQSIL